MRANSSLVILAEGLLWSMQEHPSAPGYETYASLIAPAAAGCALGILFGRGMRRGSSNMIALTLLAASAAIAAPVITGLVQRTANRPGSERGMPDGDVGEFFADTPEPFVAKGR
jgi:uncharacterized membrane protein YebE (DUF533 family)